MISTGPAGATQARRAAMSAMVAHTTCCSGRVAQTTAIAGVSAGRPCAMAVSASSGRVPLLHIADVLGEEPEVMALKRIGGEVAPILHDVRRVLDHVSNMRRGS